MCVRVAKVVTVTCSFSSFQLCGPKFYYMRKKMPKEKIKKKCLKNRKEDWFRSNGIEPEAAPDSPSLLG